MGSEEKKQLAAQAAIPYIKEDCVIGVGTGSTVNYFIDALGKLKIKIEGTVASSKATEERLKANGIKVFDLNSVSEVAIYFDGADEVNENLEMIKGGGGALTREKILAAAAKKFICIADESKLVTLLGSQAPVPIEVIPMARSYVAKKVIQLGGYPTYREGFITDNGNIILDVYHLPLIDLYKMESQLNNIVGVVCNGIFSQQRADILLLGINSGVKTLQ